MSAFPASWISREEYLRQERLALCMSEYHRGRVVPRAISNRDHVLIMGNIMGTLHEQLRERPCNNYGCGLRIGLEEADCYFYADGVVTCGREQFEDESQDVLLNPIVTIEVVSSETEDFDCGDKFFDYSSIPSLREYVLVWQSFRRIDVYRRRADGNWLYFSYPILPPPVVLESIGCTLDFDEVYAKVDAGGSDDGEQIW